MNHGLQQWRTAVLLTVASVCLLVTAAMAAAQATPEPVQVTFGAGPFDLVTPTTGLDDLSGYRATLMVSFTGTNAGQPVQWSNTYTMLVNRDLAARHLIIETSGDSNNRVSMAEIGGIFYEQEDGSQCISNEVVDVGAFAQRWEPAGFLDSVFGADDAGSEIINGIAADRYTFDEAAQGVAGIADATGELWIATDEVYLVRFVLTTTGGADYFGAEVAGTLQWAYNLTDVNRPLVIEIPEDCPAPLLDVPVMPDAAEVLQLPGVTSYNTSSGLEDVIAFYDDWIAASGAEPAGPPLTSLDTVLYGFTRGDQSLLLIASEDGSVQIQHVPDLATMATAAEPPVVEATPDVPVTLGACHEGGMPMLPDATNVQTITGAISYMTDTSVADAAAFYEEQLTAAGGRVSSSMPISDMMAMLDVQLDDQTLLVLIAGTGGTNNVTITSMTGGQLPPPAECTGD